MKRYWNSLQPAQKIIESICFLICVCAGIISIRMNFVGRSLWFDEAALAWSFSQRDLLHLTSEGLELVQAAPVGWLYLLKMITLIFGNTDFVLRVPSILFYVGTLVLLYYVSSRILCIYYPMAATAFAATLPILLQYSNVFKPYISDCFFALLAVIFYDACRKEKLTALKLGILFALLVWFSNPVCFVEGGLLGMGGLFALCKKDFSRLKQIILSAVFLVVGFVVYYVYWLRKIDDGMNGFWWDYKYRLPLSLAAIKRDWELTDLLFWQFYRWEYPVLILLAVGLLAAVIRKKETLLGLYAAQGLAVFASVIGFFPVNKRMWLFLYPLVTLMVFSLLDELVPREKEQQIRAFFMGLVFLGVVTVNGGIRYYAKTTNVYWPGYEVKAEMAYLKSVIKPEDRVYVFSSQRPIFAYYNDYNMTTLLGAGNEVMAGEHAIAEGYDCDRDLAYIVSSESCYIVMGDTWDEEASAGLLFETLEKEGCLTMVYDDYDTPLFYYTPR